MSNTASAVNAMLNGDATQTDQPVATQPTAQPASTEPVATQPVQPQEPFYRLDDRNVWNTKDDFVNAYKELHQKSNTWNIFTRPVEQGGFGFKDASHLETRLDEIAVMLAQKQEPNAQAATQPTQQTPAEAQVPPAVAEQIAQLQAQLQSLTQSQTAEQTARIEAARQQGVNLVAQQLEKAGLPKDEATVTKVASFVEDQIVRASRDSNNAIVPGSPEDRFLRGSEGERAKIVEEQVGFFTSLGTKFHEAKTAELVKSKTAAMQNQNRNLPQQSAPSASNRPAGPMTREERIKALQNVLDTAGAH